MSGANSYLYIFEFSTDFFCSSTRISEELSEELSGEIRNSRQSHADKCFTEAEKPKASVIATSASVIATSASVIATSCEQLNNRENNRLQKS